MLVNRLKYLFLIVAMAMIATPGVAQKKNKAANGSPVIWENVDVRRQDLFYGPGGRSRQPDLSNITFIKEEKGGYSKKYRIKDGSDKVWVAKVGKEAQSETAAVRLLSALGYKTEINYLVPRLTIPGKGTFTNVRLEARPADIDRGKEWRWDDNPFVGTRQLQGLKIMMAFINNWDMKNSNNVILKQQGRKYYVNSDLGVSFGKTGFTRIPLLWWIGRTRNAPNDYARSKFVTGTKNGRVKLHFNGKNYQQLKDISLTDARWLADRLSQLSTSQIQDAFRAANYSASDIDLLTGAVRSRIEQLESAANGRIAGN